MRTFLIAATLMAPTLALAAEIPKRFHGVWQLASSEVSSCKASDWTDVSARVDAKSIRFWESGCDVRKATTRRIPAGYQRTADGVTALMLVCSGEGQDWRSEEAWDLKQIGSHVLLAIARTGKEASISLYLRCDD